MFIQGQQVYQSSSMVFRKLNKYDITTSKQTCSSYSLINLFYQPNPMHVHVIMHDLPYRIIAPMHQCMFMFIYMFIFVNAL